jgi:peptidoglycan hydrolase CwlO-like protein
MLTQAKLAEQLGYNDEYLQSMESGRRPMQPHVVDGVARLRDEARFPEAFDRLVEELRTAVAAHWAGMAQPTDSNPDDEGAALDMSLTGKLEGKLDGLRVTVDVLAAKTEGRLDGLGGKLDRAEGTLAVLGNKLETASSRTEATLGALRSEVDAAAAKTEAMLDALGGRVEEASTRTEEALGALGGEVGAASARTEEAIGALGGKVDAASARTEEAIGALGGKVDTASARTEGQLNEVAANVADAGNKLDRADAKIESVRSQAGQAEKKVTRKLDMLIRALGANLIGVTALFILQCHRAPSAVHPAQGGAASIGVRQGAAEAAPKNHCSDDRIPCNPLIDSDASSQLGKETQENWIPSEPWKWQKPPPCNEKAGEEAINGGCWAWMGVKPPCGDQLWRKGDKCYRPIEARPKRPVGGEPRRPTPERP